MFLDSFLTIYISLHPKATQIRKLYRSSVIFPLIMNNARSEYVKHGIRSWIDYDRPWLLRKCWAVPRAVSNHGTTWSVAALSPRAVSRSSIRSSRSTDLVKAFLVEWVIDILIRSSMARYWASCLDHEQPPRHRLSTGWTKALDSDQSIRFLKSCFIQKDQK